MALPAPGVPPGLLRRSTQARLDYFAAYTIGHAGIVEALDAVLRAIAQPIDTWTPVILVIGPAGVGKTTLIRAVERELTRRLRRELIANPGRLPVASGESSSPTPDDCPMSASSVTSRKREASTGRTSASLALTR